MPDSDIVEIYKTVETDLSLEKELQNSITSSISVPDTDAKVTNFTNEFRVFEQCRRRTDNFDFLYKALLSIKPSSVECERTFSIAGNCCTKLRSRLNDRSLSSLVFLENITPMKSCILVIILVIVIRSIELSDLF